MTSANAERTGAVQGSWEHDNGLIQSVSDVQRRRSACGSQFGPNVLIAVSERVNEPSGAESAILSHRADSVAYLILNRPECRNALRSEHWMRLRDLALAAAQDDVAAVVLRGSRTTFCAGSDVREWHDASPEMVDSTFRSMEEALQAVEAIPVPTIAVVEGAALGAGCELVIACDVGLCTLDAQIGMPVVRLGIRPSPAFAGRLCASVGKSRARWLLYGGEIVAGGEAAAIGLCTRAVASDHLEAALTDWLQQICGQPRDAIVAAKLATGLGQATVAPDDQWRHASQAMAGRVEAFVRGKRDPMEGTTGVTQ